jgi:putative tryptophan/tyrosine transport system substrate-binding protein
MTVSSERLAVRVGKRRVGRHQKTLIGLTLLLFAICSLADAQQPSRVYRIGVLSNRSAIDPVDDAYQQRLRELGYFEGQNIVIERRMSKGKLDLLPKLATELVDLKVECLLSFGVAPTRAAKQATSAIPIVMGNADDDPVRHGLIASLSQPGGNITGFTSVSSELAGKRYC